MIPRVIGIRFPDNDFGNTIRLFLNCILQRGIEGFSDYDSGALTKEMIVDLFHKSAPGLYYLAQYRSVNSTHFDPTSYLRIDASNVFFDNEVSESIKANDGGLNGEFHVLDTQVFQPYVYSV